MELSHSFGMGLAVRGPTACSQLDPSTGLGAAVRSGCLRAPLPVLLTPCALGLSKWPENCLRNEEQEFSAGTTGEWECMAREAGGRTEQWEAL